MRSLLRHEDRIQARMRAKRGQKVELISMSRKCEEKVKGSYQRKVDTRWKEWPETATNSSS